MAKADMQDLTAALLTARRESRRFVPPDAMVLPPDHGAAYAVQRAVAAALGPVAGFKTAVRPGVPQIVAPIFAADVHLSAATLTAPKTDGLGVELEVGLRLKAPLGRLDGSAELRAAVFEPVAVIEVVDTRVAGPVASEPLVKLADNQINRALIVGPTAPAWDGGPLVHVTARMRAGDRMLVNGPATVPGGDPVDSLLSMAADLGDHCGGLQVGQIVITGSLHPLEYFSSGTEVEGHIDGIGTVSFRIA